jgi:flagellar assembly factor FliW
MARILDKRVVNPALDVACEGALESRSQSETEAQARDISTRRFMTTRFGEIEVDADLILRFPEGLIGFENCQQYVVVRHDDTSSFRWLQSLEMAAVAFPIIEPCAFRPDYAPTISDSDAKVLELNRDSSTLLFTVVSVPANNPRAMTANLLAPLVINGDIRQGKQVIVQDEGYTTRHEVVKELERAATLTVSPVAVTTLDSGSAAASSSIDRREKASLAA